MASRHIPWPSIENLGVAYANSVLYRADLVELSVVAIQRWWRWAKVNRSSSEKTKLELGLMSRKKPVTPRQLLRRILYSRSAYEHYPCIANEKFDGTNLGKAASDGTLYGRRTILGANAVSYQKAPLHKMSLVDVGLVKTELFKEAGLSEAEINSIEDVVLYGEFMLGHDKFGYRTRGVEPGSFYCFGIRLVLKGDTSSLDSDDKEGGEDTEASDSTNTTNKKLIESLRSKFGEKKVWMSSGLTISMTPALKELLLRSHTKEGSVSVVPLVAQANSIVELVLDCKEVKDLLMAAKKCEGVVVAGYNGSFNFKWKTGDEDESKSGILLQKAREMIANPAYRSTVAFGPRELEVIDALIQVANNTSKTVVKGAAPPRKAPSASAAADAAFAKEVEKAYASALTKYDSLEVYFAKNDAKTITNSLCKEVIADIKEYLAAEEQATGEKVTTEKQNEVIKAAEGLVRKKVGQSFGAWKKERSKAT
eukprot:TRINITY_DN938_c0_g1_i1.p1 TRINITY_DN938_c0_g1~~TRINITY_DN938_c0_g1_i1.p1  ORF type:complete len:480 (+),score=122.94 TRINITY_DN938_c0_g1_i1:158-1597(+)